MTVGLPDAKADRLHAALDSVTAAAQTGNRQTLKKAIGHAIDEIDAATATLQDSPERDALIVSLTNFLSASAAQMTTAQQAAAMQLLTHLMGGKGTWDAVFTPFLPDVASHTVRLKDQDINAVIKDLFTFNTSALGGMNRELRLRTEEVIYHESMHALLARIAAANPELYRQISDAAREYLPQMKTVLTEKLNRHGSYYYAEANPEETVTTLFGLWATGQIDIKGKSALQGLFDWFKNLANLVRDFANGKPVKGFSKDDVLYTFFDAFKSQGMPESLRSVLLKQHKESLVTHEDRVRYDAVANPVERETLLNLANMVGAISGFEEIAPALQEASRLPDLTVSQYNIAISKVYDRLYDQKVLPEPSGTRGEPKFMSAASTSGNRVPRGTMNDIIKEIKRVLGDTVTVEWVKNLGHAGESVTTKHLEEVIRLATTSVDPLGTAHHEALHVLLERIKRLPDGEALIEQLVAATSTAAVRRRLEQVYAADPGILGQLGDPIERLAYAYQLFRADPTFRFSPKAQGWFEGLKNFLRRLVGRMTSAQIADRVFDAFAAGTFSEPSLMNEWFVNRLDSIIPDSAVAFMNKHPLMTTLNAVKSSGDAFMRETGIPAYAKIAEMVQAGLGGTGGFLPERLRRMAQWGNRLNDIVKNASEEELAAAHRNLLLKREPSNDIERGVRKLLDDFYGYMNANGVKRPIYGTRNEAGELQVLWKTIHKRANYYPGVWDAEAIKNNREAFDALLAKHGIGANASQRGAVIENVMAGNESEHGLQGSFKDGFTPFMQATSERSLDALYDDEASLPFRQQNMVETLQRYLYQGVHRAEYVSRFGNRGEKLRMMLIDGISQGATSEQQKWAEMYAQAAEGTLGASIHPQLRDAQGWMLLYQNMRLLPLAIFSQFVDPLTIAMRSGDFRTAIRAFSLGMRGVFNRVEPSEMQRIAEVVGAIDQQSALETMGQMTGSMYMSKTQRSISDKFFKAIGMTGWNNGMRLAAFEAAYGFIKEHTLHPKQHSKRWLKELGLQEGDVQLNADGSLKISPGPGYTKDKAERVRQALNKWVNSTIVRPTAADRPIWASSPYFALVFHLKQFTYSFHRNVIKYVFREAQHGNYWPLAVATSYVPTMIASDFLRGMIQGLGEEPDYKKKWTMGDRMWNAVERSGFTGVPQFALDSLEDADRGHTGLETIMGPTLAQTSSAIQTVAGSRDGSTFLLNAMPGQVVFKHW